MVFLFNTRYESEMDILNKHIKSFVRLSQYHDLKNTAVIESSVLSLIFTIIDCLYVCKIRVMFANGTAIHRELEKNYAAV